LVTIGVNIYPIALRGAEVFEKDVISGIFKSLLFTFTQGYYQITKELIKGGTIVFSKLTQ
jgi:hypothetical protein